MRGFPYLISVCLLLSGCATAPSNQQEILNLRQENREVKERLEGHYFEIEKRLDKYEEAQKQIVSSMKEILKMLSELYQKR